MQKRGRPTGSNIRQNLIEILYFKKKACGYELYKDYIAIFPKITLRVVYYHLRKGVALGELELEEVKQEQGTYSWGSSVEKKYYRLGKKANAKIDNKVKHYFKGKKI